MKLGHYLHIAPRSVFLAQGIATLVGAIVQCGVTVFMITRIDGVCTADADGGFSCPHGRVTYSSSLIWGLSFFPCLNTLLLNALRTVLTRRKRSPRSGSKFLPRPDIREPAVVLPSWSRGRRDNMGYWPTLESCQLPVMAGGVWSDESGAAGDGHQF